MCIVYVEECLSKTIVAEWCTKFRNGHGSTQDACRSGRPSTSNTDNNKRALIIRQWRNVAYRFVRVQKIQSQKTQKSLKYWQFFSYEEVQQSISVFFKQQKVEFYQSGIFNKGKQWNACLNVADDSHDWHTKSELYSRWMKTFWSPLYLFNKYTIGSSKWFKN